MVPMSPTVGGLRASLHGTGRRGRVLVLIAILVFSLSLRTAVTSLTPLLGRIGDDLGFGSVATGLLGMLPTLLFGVAGVVGAGLGRRFGLEQVTTAAVVLTLVGIGTRAFCSSAWSLILTSTLALFGMGLGNVLVPPLVKRYFADRIAVVSTVYILCVQLGTTVPAAIAVPVADAAGWRVSLALWALVPLIALPAWLMVVRERRGAPVDDAGVAERRKLPVWRSPIAWGLTLMFGMTSLLTYSLLTWMPKVITDAGGSESLGGTAVAVFSGVGLAATVVVPWLTVRFANPFGFVAGFAVCMLAGLAGLRWAPMDGWIFWALLTGVGVCSFPMSLTLINVRTRTADGSSALSSFGQGLGYLLACAGPLLFGVLHDASGGWDLSFGVLLVATTLMTIGAWIICRPRNLEDDLARRSAAAAPDALG